MHTSVYSKLARSKRAWQAGILAVLLVTPGCTQTQREGLASSYLVIDSMAAASGAEPTKFGGVLASDVLTIVGSNPTVFEDAGQVTLRLALKDPGPITNPAQPTTTNWITVTRYHVRYIRTDGRNIQGVDVPYEFDGAATATVRDVPATIALTLVRVQAKFEAPLSGLVGSGGALFISTIAEITLFGTDQAGREVSVTGQIGVNFADWGDPAS
jgi:hypothetical protein